QVVDDRPAQVGAGAQLLEDGAELGELARAGDVRLDPTGGDQVHQLAHVLYGPDCGVHHRRVLVEERERVELDRAVTGGRQAHADEEAAGAQHVQAELEAGDLRREHEGGVDTAVSGEHRGRVGGTHRIGGTH